MQIMKRVGVIGGGLGGLSSACVLAARGHEVILLERNGWLGGKAAVLESHGFRFDMGPTILTLPSVLDRIFLEAGRDPAEMLNLVRLDPQWRSFFDDGSTLDLVADTAEMAEKSPDFLRRRKQPMGIDASWLSPKGCTAFRMITSFGDRWAVCAICLMRASRFGLARSAMFWPCSRAVRSPALCADIFQMGVFARWWIISRSMSDQPRRLAGGALRNCAHADA